MLPAPESLNSLLSDSANEQKSNFTGVAMLLYSKEDGVDQHLFDDTVGSGVGQIASSVLTINLGVGEKVGTKFKHGHRVNFSLPVNMTLFHEVGACVSSSAQIDCFLPCARSHTFGLVRLAVSLVHL